MSGAELGWQKCSLKKANPSNLNSVCQSFLALDESSPYWQQIFTDKSQESSKLKKLLQQSLTLHKTTLPANFYPKAIVLVEGTTEQILLPYFACHSGIDLLSKGIIVVSAGGAKKIIRKYLAWKDAINLPIFCLFDRDAQYLAQVISANLRESDYVYVLSDGEIEDLMPLEFLIKKLNQFFSADPLYDRTKPILPADFSNDKRRTVVLEKIWREKELGKFEKVKFAQFIADQPLTHDCQANFISDDGKHMLDILIKIIDQTSSNKNRTKYEST